MGRETFLTQSLNHQALGSSVVKETVYHPCDPGTQVDVLIGISCSHHSDMLVYVQQFCPMLIIAAADLRYAVTECVFHFVKIKYSVTLSCHL